MACKMCVIIESHGSKSVICKISLESRVLVLAIAEHDMFLILIYSSDS